MAKKDKQMDVQNFEWNIRKTFSRYLHQLGTDYPYSLRLWFMKCKNIQFSNTNNEQLNVLHIQLYKECLCPKTQVRLKFEQSFTSKYVTIHSFIFCLCVWLSVLCVFVCGNYCQSVCSLKMCLMLFVKFHKFDPFSPFPFFSPKKVKLN